MKVLVAEKDRLLDQKKVLAEELQHRVRNNLQLVYGMLSKQLDDTRGQGRATRHQGDRAPGFHPGAGL
jgi:two-component sensor histidine kinase